MLARLRFILEHRSDFEAKIDHFFFVNFAFTDIMQCLATFNDVITDSDWNFYVIRTKTKEHF